MKKLIIFVSLLFLAMAYGKAEDKEVLKIATFNLRMDTPSDGENAWFHRKDMVNDLIRFYGFDLFGTQEGFTHQLNDILRLSDYRFIGVGRDDGKDAGEHCAIFYRSDRFKVLDQVISGYRNIPRNPVEVGMVLAVTGFVLGGSLRT